MTDRSPGLRERTRNAVQWEIAESAGSLFVEQGYDETTIDDVAAAIGMSKRSVFRYFETKEDLVLGKFDALAGAMLAGLRARPAGESTWESLRAMLAFLVPHVDSQGRDAVTAPLQRLIFETPVLLAGYLERQHQVQKSVVSILRERAVEAGRPFAVDDPAPRVLTAAAFGCLMVAQQAWLENDADSFAEVLDRALSVLD
ncbi:TetR/AcrR family transcriptional regulator [Microtetraspora malaysiensis]|uniref:TetR/AcrR family transcriptional regulator n=1 Tax=Microtetraspora malaysiensis TaxID=161358 RepID=UPI003D8D8D07